MTKILIKRVNECLSNIFGQDNKYEDVLILDSTSSSKFSVHLVFTDISFCDNIKMGEFVRFFESKLNEEDQKLFQVSHKGKSRSFIDKSVYSHNQNFRLYLSTKYQKPTPLIVANYDDFVKKLQRSSPTLSPSEFQYQIFENSLISTIGPNCKMVDMSTITGEPAAPTSDRKNVEEGTGASPYPELDRFVRTHLKQGGFIQSWHLNRSLENRIVYRICGNRFCSNVGRQHASNNIFYICDLMDMTMNQCCYSCVGYKGPDICIPRSMFDWIDAFNESF